VNEAAFEALSQLPKKYRKAPLSELEQELIMLGGASPYEVAKPKGEKAAKK